MARTSPLRKRSHFLVIPPAYFLVCIAPASNSQKASPVWRFPNFSNTTQDLYPNSPQQPRCGRKVGGPPAGNRGPQGAAFPSRLPRFGRFRHRGAAAASLELVGMGTGSGELHPPPQPRSSGPPQPTCCIWTAARPGVAVAKRPPAGPNEQRRPGRERAFFPAALSGGGQLCPAADRAAPASRRPAARTPDQGREPAPSPGSATASPPRPQRSFQPEVLEPPCERLSSPLGPGDLAWSRGSRTDSFPAAPEPLRLGGAARRPGRAGAGRRPGRPGALAADQGKLSPLTKNKPDEELRFIPAERAGTFPI